MASGDNNSTYENMERPYGVHLERETDTLMPTYESGDATLSDAGSSDGAGTTTPSGGSSQSDGVAVTGEQELGDLWIGSFIKSKNWKPKVAGFYIDGRTGYAEFSSIYVGGMITTITGGSIGGWTIAADEIYKGDVHIKSTAERILMGSATAPATGTGIFLGKDGSDYKFRIGNPASNYMLWDGSILALQGGVVTSLGQGSDLSILGWQFDSVFSASSQTVVAWTSGTLRFHNGVNYSITGANTGTMAATTYIYFDSAVSTTALQTTTTASTAVGANKVLIAVAKNNSESGKNATFQVFGGTGGISPFITASNIAADTITANEIAANTISASELATTLLYAGAITLDTNGHIKGGQTAYDTGTGFFLGYSGSAYKFSMGIGGQDDNNIRWDGSKLIVNGYDQTGIGTYGGNGSDGSLTVSGTTTLNAGQLYQYTSVTIQNGGTLKFTGNGIGQILCSGNFDLQAGGTIELRWTTTAYIGGVVGIHALESGNTYKVLATNSLGGLAETAGLGGDGGAGGDGIGAGAGTGGSAGSNAATPGNGTDGVDGTTNTTGGGGGGGGGANATGGTAPTAGAAASGVNGGAGGVGGTAAANATGGNGGGGGGGTGAGNGGAGGQGGDGIGNGNGGDGGNGGDSGPTGGNGGAGGTGGSCDTPAGIYDGGDGGDGGNGYSNGGNGGTGGSADGGSSYNGDGGYGGDGGDAFLGTGGRGGSGGDGTDQGVGRTGGSGGDGYTGGDGGQGGDAVQSTGSADSGSGGDGGDAYSGAIPLFVFAAGNLTIAGTVNAQGGRGGDGGNGGNHQGSNQTPGSGGDGGNGGDGADVYMLCKGTFSKSGNIYTSGGRGGTPGVGGMSVSSSGVIRRGVNGDAGVPGRSGRAITGSITI